MNKKITVRRSRVEDLEKVLELVKELAVFEKAPDEVNNTIEKMKKDGFSLDKMINGGVWVKSLSACEVFNLFCSNNFIIKLIGDLEAILFVSLVFGLYFLIHYYLVKK